MPDTLNATTSPIVAALEASADATIAQAEGDIAAMLAEIRQLGPRTFAALAERVHAEVEALASGSTPPADDGARARAARTADSLALLRERVADAWAVTRLLWRLLDGDDVSSADLRAAARVAGELSLDLEDIDGCFVEVAEGIDPAVRPDA